MKRLWIVRVGDGGTPEAEGSDGIIRLTVDGQLAKNLAQQAGELVGVSRSNADQNLGMVGQGVNHKVCEPPWS